MKILCTILAFSLCTAALSQITTIPSNTPSMEQSTTLSPDTTTTTVSSTTDISTTTPSTTTSTEVPTTTSSTTTAASSTTEEPTPSPSPVPAPEKCTWNVTEMDLTCIRAEMKARFIIEEKGQKSYINLGCNATLLSSDCSSNTTQTLILSEEDKYILTMVFEKDSDKFFVKNITLDYTLPDGEKGFASSGSEKLFSAKIGNSYFCRSDSEIHLGNVTTMQVSDIRIQAFGDKGNTNFGTAEECDADDKVNGIIPIAVGVALAALIIIVLIAYLVGRRRSRQRGYQSV